MPKHIRNRYKWGINHNKPLPYAYCLLKAKKQFSAARSIIAYRNTAFEKLFAAVAAVLQQILSQAYGTHQFGHRPNHTIWADLHAFLQGQAGHNLHLDNDDLVGFFTSIPQDAIIRAVQHCLDTYFRKHPQQGRHSFTFTVIVKPTGQQNQPH